MEYNVSTLNPNYNFRVTSASYIGKPVSNTFMFITRKVERLLEALEDVEHCLVFAESGMQVTDGLIKKHCFMFSDNPQLAYARFANKFANEHRKEEQNYKYNFVNGSYISETAKIGSNVYIEPNCLIGHNVVIGENAQILAGAIIKNAIIGDDFIANEGAVIGAAGFTMAEDELGNKLRIPTLGKVIIGNDVEIGVNSNISCGSGGNTVIDDNVKIDTLVHIAHDVHLEKNVEITAGVIIGGFVNMAEHSYVGINAALRNRINIGSDTIVGMGSTVITSFPEKITIVGNPAQELVKKE